MRIPTSLSVLAASAIVVAGLAGCSSSNDDPASTPTVTDTVTAAPATPDATTTPSVTPSTTSSPSATSGSGSTAAPAVTTCTSSNLSAAIVSGSGGAAGSTYVNLSLTNKGSSTCTLQGWPGVSLVGSGNGTQLGKAAKLDRSSAHATVSLKAGASAQAQLQIVQADNYERSQCKPAKGDGFRVYPPGSKSSIFATYAAVTGCKSTSVSLFTVGALHQ